MSEAKKARFETISAALVSPTGMASGVEGVVPAGCGRPRNRLLGCRGRIDGPNGRDPDDRQEHAHAEEHGEAERRTVAEPDRTVGTLLLVRGCDHIRALAGLVQKMNPQSMNAAARTAYPAIDATSAMLKRRRSSTRSASDQTSGNRTIRNRGTDRRGRAGNG